MNGNQLNDNSFGIEITDINIHKIEDGIKNCVGIAQVVLNECIMLTGIKLYDTGEKRYVLYPRNLSNKKGRNFFYPLNKEVGDYLSNSIWDVYSNS